MPFRLVVREGADKGKRALRLEPWRGAAARLELGRESSQSAATRPHTEVVPRRVQYAGTVTALEAATTGEPAAALALLQGFVLRRARARAPPPAGGAFRALFTASPCWVAFTKCLTLGDAKSRSLAQSPRRFAPERAWLGSARAAGWSGEGKAPALLLAPAAQCVRYTEGEIHVRRCVHERRPRALRPPPPAPAP